MANELQQITFPGWLGVGGGIRFTCDTSAFPNGFPGDTGFYTTWDSSYTAAQWLSEINMALYLGFGFNTVCTLIQATDPIIVQVEFTNCTAPPFGPDLGNLDVPEIEIPNWYGNGANTIPTVATIREGDTTEIMNGGVKCGGAPIPQVITSRTVSGGAVCAGSARIYMGWIASGGTVAGGSATITSNQTLRGSGGALCGGTASNQMVRNPATSGGVVIVQPGYANGYKRRHTITIPADVFTESIPDFILPIRIQADADYISSNLIFTDDADVRLPHDLVAIQSGKVFAYVRTNITANQSKNIRMYFDA